MRLRRTLQAAVAIGMVATGSAMTAASADASGVVTISGARTASIVVNLPAVSALASTLDATMRGTYAGYLVFRLHGDTKWPVLAQIKAPGLGLGRDWAIPIASGRTLSAGRYRVVLFTDGPATIRLPSPTSAHLTIRPRTPVPAFATWLKPRPDVAGVHTGTSIGARVPAGVWAEAGMIQASTSSMGSRVRQSTCITAQASCTENAYVHRDGRGSESDGAFVELVGPSPLGYREFIGDDTVDFGIPSGYSFRTDSIDVNGNDVAFAWGVGRTNDPPLFI
jgi:hypothetical protein